MSSLIVAGGVPLSGSCRIGGAKNAALPILAACMLLDRPVRLIDCPRLKDVDNMLRILKTLGCRAAYEGGELLVDASAAGGYELPELLTKSLRSSVFLLGPLLARFGRAAIAYPGGCEIGHRPIDLHIKGLQRLNAKISERAGCICCETAGLRGADIHLDYPSVGATENIMMAAVAAEGRTVIRNAAREPEICALQDFLCAAGFQVMGAGSSSVTIQGGGSAQAVRFAIMPDRIVAGTLLAAAAITGGELRLTNVVPEHLAGTLAKLMECGCEISMEPEALRLAAPARPSEIKLIETLPHPGFPTDMQAQMFALCTVARGTSVIVENVFENRFKHAQELAKMGADCTVRGRMAVIRGVEKLHGAHVSARDLRGGAALTLAALRARGESMVSNAELIDRGYEGFDEMLRALGAVITREA
ncbi:MAG: UDP-N-acetylglucosamine 1-carboxyvinyltransferase [Clostridia bacterium]|nr:UDP-N-acetylglucosamine 1-carboxyvinyltransferase [Clostridia bacterium]